MSTGRDVSSLLLLAPPTFAEGVAEAFDVFGTTLAWNDSLNGVQADLLALRADWVRVGDDLRQAIAEYRSTAP